MDAMAEEILEIADDARNDYVNRITADGEVERMSDMENIQRSKLQIDTRKWIMSRLALKKHGGKLDLSASVGLDFTKLSDAELVARTKAVMASLGTEGDVHPLPLTLSDAVEVDIED